MHKPGDFFWFYTNRNLRTAVGSVWRHMINHGAILCWSQRFCLGQDTTEDKEHYGRPRTSKDNTFTAITATILGENRPIWGLLGKHSAPKITPENSSEPNALIGSWCADTPRPCKRSYHTYCKGFFTSYKWEVLPHPNHSPDFNLFQS